MFLLSESESNQWSELARHALEDGPAEPRDHAFVVAPTMRAAFFYYVGGLFAAAGLVSDARRWLEAGRDIEPIPACACLLDVLDRHGDTLVIPEVIFSDPRPWGHFAGLPTLRTARENFLRIATDSLPHFEEPLRLIDVGCGSGELGVRLMRSLIEAGKVGRVGAVALIDPSAGMLEAAGRNVAEAFPTRRSVSSNRGSRTRAPSASATTWPSPPLPSITCPRSSRPNTSERSPGP